MNGIDHFVFIGDFHVQWYSGIILLATEGTDDKGGSAVVPKSMIAVILKYSNFEIFAVHVKKWNSFVGEHRDAMLSEKATKGIR